MAKIKNQNSKIAPVIWSGPNTAQKWHWLLLLGTKSLAPKFDFFLLVKNSEKFNLKRIILIWSVCKERCT